MLARRRGERKSQSFAARGAVVAALRKIKAAAQTLIAHLIVGVAISNADRMLRAGEIVGAQREAGRPRRSQDGGGEGLREERHGIEDRGRNHFIALFRRTIRGEKETPTMADER